MVLKIGELQEKNLDEDKNKIKLLNLPEELLIKIFITLPVKSLVRLRCVGKSLESILKNPYFINLHMKQQHECILISNKNRSLLSFHSYESLKVISPHVEIPHFDSMWFDIAWPCNGLLFCISVLRNTSVLCNPSTRESKILPPLPFPRSSWYISIGLGFDSNKNDYKVVILASGDHKSAVYSLSSNSWRQIDLEMPFMDSSHGNDVGVPCDGALHWTAEREGIDYILSFDVSTELFQDIELPDSIALQSSTSGINKIPTIINDSLALFAFSRNHSESKFVEIWLMKEYNVVRSWTKQFSIRLPTYNVITPCLLWKNEAILMDTNGSKLKSCNVNTHKITDMGINGRHKVVVYKESLVSIK